MRRSPKTNSSVQRRGFPSSGTQLFGWAPALRGVSPSSSSAPHPTHAILRGGSGSLSQRALFFPPSSRFLLAFRHLRPSHSAKFSWVLIPGFEPGYPPVLHGLVAKAPSGLSGLDSTLVRTPAFQKRLPIRARRTSRQYPSEGRFYFFLFFLPLPFRPGGLMGTKSLHHGWGPVIVH